MIKIKRIKCALSLKDIRDKILVHPYNSKHAVNTEGFKVIFANVTERKRLHNKYLKHEGEYVKDSYRGFFQGNIIIIYVNSFDTFDSLKWLFVHEITHREINRSSVINSMFLRESLKFRKQTEKKYKQKWDQELYNKDDVHDNVPAEIFCDRVATTIVGKNYGRKWWRKNLKLTKFK